MYQYETSPRKLTEYDIPKKQVKKAKKSKKENKIAKKKRLEESTKARRNFTIITAFALLALLVIVYMNVRVNESFSEVQSLQKEIASLEKENSQISVNIQNSLNLSNIETAATTNLGMQKLTNKQTVYVSLDTKDYIEVTNDSTVEEEESLIEKLWNSFLDLF